MGLVSQKVNYSVDPWDSDDIKYLHVQSLEYSGNNADLTAPSAPNFPNPLSASSTRYFLDTPWIIDVSDLAGSRPIIIKDVTTATVLTRVSGSPGANEYRVPPATSSRRHSIEIHSGQAAHQIGYDMYAIGSVLDETDVLSKIVFDIGDWDMDANGEPASGAIDLLATYGITKEQVRSVSVMIVADVGVSGKDVTDLCQDPGSGVLGSWQLWDESGMGGYVNTLDLARTLGKKFDSTSYDATSYNRGWVTLWVDIS